jgi:hypothetical protein
MNIRIFLGIERRALRMLSRLAGKIKDIIPSIISPLRICIPSKCDLM